MLKKSKDGFTIIEVVLVLAIAGLIFLMVFTALPALQRSQRNTQRKMDMARVMTAAQSFRSRNGGVLPFNKGSMDGSGDTEAAKALTEFVKKNLDSECTGKLIQDPGTTEGSRRFRWSNDASCSEQFSDPDGELYDFDIRRFVDDSSTYDEVWHFGDEHTILVSLGWLCGDGEGTTEGVLTSYKRKRATGKNDFMIVFPLEGGSAMCIDTH